MSNNQLAGFPAYGARVDTSITYNPVAYIPESPIALPTTAPGTAQLQFTINTASLPAFSPVAPDTTTPSSSMAVKYQIVTIIGFKNNAATLKYVSMKYKTTNPSTFTDGPWVAIGAGKYKTLTFIGTLSSFSLNDVHEVKVQGGTTEGDISLLWAYMIVIPNYTVFSTAGRGLYDLIVTVSQASWIGAASVGTPTAGYSGYKVHVRLANGNASDSELNASMNMPVFAIASNITTLMRAPGNSPEAGAYDTGDRSTDDKYHYQIYYPTRIAYTPIL